MVGRGAVAAHGWYGLENYSRERLFTLSGVLDVLSSPPGFQKVHLLLRG